MVTGYLVTIYYYKNGVRRAFLLVLASKGSAGSATPAAACSINKVLF